jgi:hypothetical protein
MELQDILTGHACNVLMVISLYCCMYISLREK